MRPAYRIIANGDDITNLVAGKLKTLTITDDTGFESDTLQISLADTDNDAPFPIPPTGAELEVWMGYDDTLQRMGLFIVDEIETGGWPAYMDLRGRAAPFESTGAGRSDLQTQKTRSWPEGTRLGEMADTIAQEHGLESAVAQSLRGMTLAHFDQTEESDISFLVRVAQRHGAIVKPGGGKLALAKRGESRSATGEELPTVTLDASECTRWSMSITTRDTVGTVVAYYQDQDAAERRQVSAGEGDPVRRMRHNYPDQESAEAAAQSELDRRERRENRFSASMPGAPTLTGEGQLALTGFRPGLVTRWLISKVTHNLDTSRGYSCDIEAELPDESD